MASREKTIMSNVTGRPPATRTRGILTVIAGADVGRVISLPGGAATIGRNDDSTIRFDDGSVSGKHGIVMGLGGNYVFHDNSSTNGSYVNDVRTQESVVLRDGDRIRFGTSTTVRFSLVDEQEEKALKKVFEAAHLDALTGVLNRRALEERIEAELAYANRHGTPVSVVIFDIDHFKKVNDTYGHLAGDAVLRAVAGLARHSLRAEDTIGRYGGEEFVVVARGITPPEARALAERMRQTVEATTVPYEAASLKVTASSGVASIDECGDKRDRTTLLALADGRLYRAKGAGRNRVVSD